MSEIERGEMAMAPERCLLCSETDNSTGTDTNADQGAVQRVNSSTSKKLYPKILLCGHIIWICSTCPIKSRTCPYCSEDLLESQFVTEENLTHTQLFTDLTMSEERENRIILQNENNVCMNCQNNEVVSFCPQCECKFLCQDCSKQHCKKEKKKDNKTKHHIVKHIERIKECTQNKKSSPCVVHTDTNSDFFCRTHNVPVCQYCIYLNYHRTCKVNGFTESLGETRNKLEDFIKKLEPKERDFELHFQRIKDQKEAINEKLTGEFNQLRSWIDGLEEKLKKSVEDEYDKQQKNILRQKERVPVHKTLVERILESPPDVAFFDMTQTLAVIVNNIEKDISELNDVNVQMEFQEIQESRENLEKNIKSLTTRMFQMRFVSRGSHLGNVMRSKSSKKTECTLYSRARSVSGPRGSMNINESGMTQETKNVVYVYTCTKCRMLYVGETSQMLEDRDRQHRKGNVYKHECALAVERREEQKHFIVSCVRKDLDDENQRFMMETLIMLRLGTLKPDGINKILPPHAVQTSLEILRSETLDEADQELVRDAIDGRNGFNSFSCNVLKFNISYEVLLEEINDNNIIIIISENSDEYETICTELPEGMSLVRRLGFALNGHYGYVFVDGVRYYSTRLSDNLRSRKYRVLFSACSKITGLAIQPQKTWKFKDKCICGTVTLPDEKAEIAECKSSGCIRSEKSMELNILYEVFVDELYQYHNGFSLLGVSTAPMFGPVQLSKHSHCGVVVDAQMNLHLFLNGVRRQIIRNCVTLPCYFLLWSNNLKVSTLPETKVFFDQEGNIIA